MKNFIPELHRSLPPAVQPLTLDPRPSSFRRFGALAGGALLLLRCLVVDAATIAVQDFETTPATPTAQYSASGGSIQTGRSTLNDQPADSPYYSGGAQSYQVNNGTATLTFDAINTSGYTGIQLTLRVAAFSINTSANGLDDTDYVEVQISPDGGTNYYPTARVKGITSGYGARWSYAGGTGNASTAYDGDTTVVQFAPGGGGNRTTDGYSTITITSLPAASQLQVKIIMLNNSTYERWVIDDLQITGTPVATLSAGNNGPICAGSTLNLTASTISGANYAWTGPNGFASNVQNPTIANATTAASGTYSVTATVNDWTSAPATTSVTVNAAPTTSAITGSGGVAIGQLGKVYSVTLTSGSSYAWTVPNGAVITAGSAGPNNNQITVAFGSASGDVTVTETTSAGCVGSPVPLTVTVGPNHAPVAPNSDAGIAANHPLVLSVTKLLREAGDGDTGDTLSIAAAGPSSTNGPANNVVLNSGAGTITYTPATDYVGADSFTYTVSDNCGGTASPTVVVMVTATNVPSPNIVIPPAYDSGNGRFKVTFAGIPGYIYTVQRATDPNGPWSVLKTATAGTDGLFEVTDTQDPPPPARYYRTVYP